ncbi:transposase [Agrobacterium salinitolerans]|nr:transposase [Agrobacterium salinitolerans]
MAAKRNPYTIKLQVVYAIAHDVTPILAEEADILGDAFRSAARNFKCDIISTTTGERWFEAMLATEASFDIPKAMTSLKTVTSRAMNGARGSNAVFWSPGYMVVSIGEPVNPEDAAMKLESKGHKK